MLLVDVASLFSAAKTNTTTIKNMLLVDVASLFSAAKTNTTTVLNCFLSRQPAGKMTKNINKYREHCVLAKQNRTVPAP